MSALAIPRSHLLRIGRLRLPAGLSGLFVCLAFGLMLMRPSLNGDLGLHLRTGRLILATHAVPTADSFSFTLPGAHWVDHEWLWEATMAALASRAGLVGVVAVGSLVAAITLAFVYLRLRAREVAPLYAAAGAAVAGLIVLPYSGARPAVLAPLMSAVFLFAFERYEGSRDWRWLAALLPCELLWANCHPSFVIGPLLCGVYGAAALWQSARLRSVLPWGMLCVGLTAVSLANPLGPNLLRFTLLASRLPFSRQYIGEWQAPDLAGADRPLLICLILSLPLLVLWKKRTGQRRQVLLLAICTLAALQSREFVPLYAVAVAPLLAELLHGLLGRPGRQEILPLTASVLLATLVGIAAAVPVRLLPTQAYQATLAQAFPVNAVAFVEGQHLQGPMWDEFDWAGYLIDALPRLPVFVDGRVEMYGNTFLYQYAHVAQGVTPARPVFDRYGINLALIETGSPLAAELRQTPRWREAYKDGIASVFVREDNA